jgi:osmoprotectant transport system permease protein
VDGLLALIEAGLRRRSRWRVGSAWALLAAALVLAPSCLCPARPPARRRGDRRQELLRAIYIGERDRARLQAAGYRTERRDNLGSTVAYQALAAGDIDVYVDYSGTLWTNILQRTDTPAPAAMLATLTAALRAANGVLLLGPLGFENAYALAMRRSRAEALGLRTLDDLARAAPRLRLGADLEFLTRPEWRSVQAAYASASPASAPTARPSCTARSPTARPT